MVLGAPVKNYLKWQTIQVAIHSTDSYRVALNCMQASVFLPKIQYFHN